MVSREVHIVKLQATLYVGINDADVQVSDDISLLEKLKTKKKLILLKAKESAAMSTPTWFPFSEIETIQLEVNE